MAIRVTDLRSAATRNVAVLRNLSEAKSRGAKSAFLCHSHKDVDLAKGIVNLLAEAGLNAYVDWADTSMPEVPNRQTAERIQEKIRDLTFFLFLATANSVTSRWCPWEIGYADGKKPLSSIFIISTTDGSATHGSEYLGLYRQIDASVFGELVIREAGSAPSPFNLRSL
jgi:hypothetical protein